MVILWKKLVRHDFILAIQMYIYEGNFSWNKDLNHLNER